MQKILTQLIKEKELPRALQWCNVSTEQGIYLGENLRKPPCIEKGIIKTALLHSLAGHQQGDFEEAARWCFNNLFSSTATQMWHVLMRTTFPCNSTERDLTTLQIMIFSHNILFQSLTSPLSTRDWT